MVQPVPSVNHAGPVSPLTTEAEPSAAERLSWLIASWPAHERDLGPENEVIGDVVSPDAGQEIGEVPATLLRLAEHMLSGAMKDFGVSEIAAGLREDWVLVPRVPTMEMLRVGVEVAVNASPHPWLRPAWTAMLAAAPLGNAPAPSIAASRGSPGETVEGDVRPPETPVVGDLLNPDLGEER